MFIYQNNDLYGQAASKRPNFPTPSTLAAWIATYIPFIIFVIALVFSPIWERLAAGRWEEPTYPGQLPEMAQAGVAVPSQYETGEEYAGAPPPSTQVSPESESW